MKINISLLSRCPFFPRLHIPVQTKGPHSTHSAFVRSFLVDNFKNYLVMIRKLPFSVHIATETVWTLGLPSYIYGCGIPGRVGRRLWSAGLNVSRRYFPAQHTETMKRHGRLDVSLQGEADWRDLR